MEYKTIRSNRVRIAIKLIKDGSIVVYAPLRVSGCFISEFVEQNKSKIESALKKQAIAQAGRIVLSQEEINELIEKGKALFPRWVADIATEMGVVHGEVHVSAATSYWGVCAGIKNTIRLNYRLLKTNENIIRYVIVHELAHVIHKGHKKNFWDEVAKYCPNNKLYRQELRRLSMILI